MRSRLVLFLLVLVPTTALGWGFTAHRRLASKMQEALPTSCLKDWLAARQTAALQDRACDPDRWRYTTSPQYDPDEWPRHYLEVDRINPPAAYPREWAAVQMTFGQYANKNGKVPFRVEEMYGLLVDAFAAKNEAQILDRAFLLSHYVTDAFSLLHDTLNFDPNGLHSRWESDMFGVAANLSGITAASVAYYGTPGKPDPRYAIFDVVLVGNAQAPTLIAADVAHPDMPGFYTAVKDLTARRWGDALTVLASLLWSAWADAGAPELPGFGTSCSRAVPTALPVLVGFPVPGGFTSRDGGFVAPDASIVDAGYDDAGEPNEWVDGGEGGGSSSVGGGGAATQAPIDCSCSASGALGGLALAAAALTRRRERASR